MVSAPAEAPEPLRFASSSSSSASPPDLNELGADSLRADSPHGRKRHTEDSSYAEEEDEPPVKSKKADQGAPAAIHNGKGRKPITEKRRDQNRRAQQAFRDRKEARVHDLETQVQELTDLNEQKDMENASLRQLIHQLRAENAKVYTSDGTATPPQPLEAEPAFTFELPRPAVSRSSSEGMGLQEGFIAGLTGYAFSPSALGSDQQPDMAYRVPAGEETLPLTMDSPSAALSPGNFGNIEDYLALDDGTTVSSGPPVRSASLSSTSEAKTPGEAADESAQIFDVDNFCTQFQEKAQCHERIEAALRQSEMQDKEVLARLQQTADADPTRSL